MSNLGAYQKITTISKKFGGPVGFLVTFGFSCAVVGAGLYKVGEPAVTRCWDDIKSRRAKQPIFKDDARTVTAPGVSNEGLTFDIGDQLRVLEVDGDAVLIEKIGDENNPYFISTEFLSVICDT